MRSDSFYRQDVQRQAGLSYYRNPYPACSALRGFSPLQLRVQVELKFKLMFESAKYFA
jgi:hypothetical protein